VGLQEGLEATVGWFSDERHRTALFSGRIGDEVGRADLIAAE
jgi:hypothetical protein